MDSRDFINYLKHKGYTQYKEDDTIKDVDFVAENKEIVFCKYGKDNSFVKKASVFNRAVVLSTEYALSDGHTKDINKQKILYINTAYLVKVDDYYALVRSNLDEIFNIGDSIMFEDLDKFVKHGEIINLVTFDDKDNTCYALKEGTLRFRPGDFVKIRETGEIKEVKFIHYQFNEVNERVKVYQFDLEDPDNFAFENDVELHQRKEEVNTKLPFNIYGNNREIHYFNTESDSPEFDDDTEIEDYSKSVTADDIVSNSDNKVDLDETTDTNNKIQDQLESELKQSDNKENNITTDIHDTDTLDSEYDTNNTKNKEDIDDPSETVRSNLESNENTDETIEKNSEDNKAKSDGYDENIVKKIIEENTSVYDKKQSGVLKKDTSKITNNFEAKDTRTKLDTSNGMADGVINRIKQDTSFDQKDVSAIYDRVNHGSKVSRKPRPSLEKHEDSVINRDIKELYNEVSVNLEDRVEN